MARNDVRIGSIKRLDNHFEAKLERIFNHEQNAVWRMLIEAQKLTQWLAPGSIELRPGGAVHIDFADGGRLIESTVLEFDPPNLPTYSWSGGNEPERPSRWQLDIVEAGTRLLLTLRLPVTGDIATPRPADEIMVH